MDKGLLASLGASGRVLIVVAAELEARAVRAARPDASGSAGAPPWSVQRLDDRFDLLISGVGKANAAGAIARALDAGAHRAVVNTGVCGALPGSGLEPGALLFATSSVFADEGLRTPDAFEDIASMGFPPVEGAGVGFAPDPALAHALAAHADARGAIACVSTCSGTDDLARDIVARTGAIGEAMEGAAAGVVCARLGVPFAEARAVSNTTGDRDRQRWDLRAATARLQEWIATW